MRKMTFELPDDFRDRLLRVAAQRAMRPGARRVSTARLVAEALESFLQIEETRAFGKSPIKRKKSA